jgi:micrococcal nuclease
LPPSDTPIETIEVPVVRVIDADTIKVRYQGKLESVRLIGIDTPETTRGKNEPFGKQARAFLEALLEDREVRIEFDVERRDRYGRLLAYVWAQGEDDPAPILANAQLAHWGYAQLLTIPPNVKYVERLRSAVETARMAQVNLWRDTQ